MRNRRPATSVMTVCLCIVVLLNAAAVSSDEPGIDESIRQVLDKLVAVTHQDERTAQNARELRRLVEQLREMPGEPVVRNVVLALRDDPDFAHRDTRRAAYDLLLRRGAAQYSEGFDQLLLGVRDPDGLHASLGALGLTSREKYPRLVETLTPLLTDPEFPQERLMRVLELLGKTGSTAAPALPAVVGIYHDHERDHGARMAAAQAMVRIGCVLHAIEEFGLDPLVARSSFEASAIVWALVLAGEETEGTFNLDAPMRAIPRALIRSAMDHEDESVREAAAWALLLAYSREERVLVDAEGEYRIHPELFQSVVAMAETDPSPDLRAGAEQVLREHFPRALQRRLEADQAQGEE